jgi:hypothetical protein
MALSYIEAQDASQLGKLLNHPTAVRTYSHAIRFANTEYPLSGFWTHILDNLKEKGSGYLAQVRQNFEYVQDRHDDFEAAISRLYAYVPADYQFDCNLYFNIGYDIGIVSDGDALLNMGHPHFIGSPQEMLYYAMHELHHVCYTHYNPIFTMDDLKTTEDLLNIIYYATHMEGLGVYCSLESRISDGQLADADYTAILDKHSLIQRLSEYSDITNSLKDSSVRLLKESDFEAIETMSGRGKRLWYVTGAHMARTIDAHCGRSALVDTIRAGPNKFVELYYGIVPDR